MDEELQIKKLDALFFLFREEQVGIAKHFIKEMMLGKGFEVSNVEIERYLDQLIDDGYIMLTADDAGTRIYIIKIKGLLFDGYEQQILSRISENTRLETLENSQRANQTLTTWLTVLIAFGTLLAAVYYSIEICNRFSPILHQHDLYWIWEAVPKRKS
ncbi:hypothetical protein SAMN05428975_1776 [Mucilaginibacter sp. OK268]|uniref:hypothetical protein n=1 Tax=Mucilaginibacter sp. OK268 TaxID=1881048 RepID=UPI00088D2D59|nr:hypothetical protein [Mucilaginibacter sp. OK268]SDP55414.1 hypothetical protein SAMN05428975_1776 [Mucilaginibacter sp. OK268]